MQGVNGYCLLRLVAHTRLQPSRGSVRCLEVLVFHSLRAESEASGRIFEAEAWRNHPIIGRESVC